MLKPRLAVVLSALVIGCAATAHATTIPISGAFSGGGADSFTSNNIVFGAASITAGTSITGTFATYFGNTGGLANNNPITFISLVGGLPYASGVSITPPLGTYPLGYVPDFYTINGVGAYSSDVFGFNLASYTATYSPTGALAGCTPGVGACLDVTGTGFFSVSGADTGTSGPATFTFTSQYNGLSYPSVTSFSASTSAPAVSPIPEPASLALVGSGLFGLVGIVRRRMQRA